MTTESSPIAIQDTIRQYASAYRALQDWQEKRSPLIPMGDQKTGCIGEFYVYLYLSHRFPEAVINYGGHSEKGWDISVSSPSPSDFKVQVKTVSAYSTTRTMSPIHHGWDEMHVVYLDKGLEPEGFWIIRDRSIVSGNTPLKGKKCPNPAKLRTGSKNIPFGKNLISDLRESLVRMFSTQ